MCGVAHCVQRCWTSGLSQTARGFLREAGVSLSPCWCRVEFSLLSADEQRARGIAKPLEQVQLVSRHWRILRGGQQIDQVVGEGVVGLYPLLTAGARLPTAIGCKGWTLQATAWLPSLRLRRQASGLELCSTSLPGTRR